MLLFDVQNVRVVGIDLQYKIVDDSAGKRSAVDSEDGCHIYHTDQSSTSSGCISMQLLLDEVGRCAGVDDIGRYCRNLLDNTGMKRVVLQDGYCTGIGVEIFDYTEHMSRVQD